MTLLPYQPSNHPYSHPHLIHDPRRPACTSYGLGTAETILNVNMLSQKSSDDYCGVFINDKSEERSVAVAVRIHKTLELADDKFYMITCGKAGFTNR